MNKILIKIFKRMCSSILQEAMGTITHVITNEPVVAVTFDDGPIIETTPAILDLLESHNARGTFFMVGENATKCPEIVQRMTRAGHAVGNHSWDHPSFPLISGSERRRQIRACERTIAGYSHKLFRPPYGDQSHGSRFDIFLMGYSVITWNLLTEDWRNVDVGVMVDKLAGEIKAGSIILFHDTLYTVSDDLPADRNLTLHALERVLQRFSEQFRFVSVPELLNQGIPFYAKWYQKPNVEYLNKLQGTRGRKIRRYNQNGLGWRWE